MKPKLLVINGALSGETFPLADGEMSIGRDPSSTVCLQDPAASRRHCLVRGEGARFCVVDLQSFNGTLVNGIHVQEQALEHGDQIAVGDTLFLFILHDDADVAKEGPVTFEEVGRELNSTIRLLKEDAIFVHPEKLREALSLNARIENELGALLKISSVINSLREAKTLQRQLLQLVLEIIPAEQAALLLTGASAKEIVLVAGASRKPDSEEPVRVSMTVVNQVLHDATAVLSTDIRGTQDFAAAESLIDAQTRSLLCAPLLFFESVTGALYLNSNRAGVFDSRHLQLITGVAAITAVALENALHYECVEGENLQLQDESMLEHQMIGSSPAMRKVYNYIAQVAPTSSTILIRGESGTGKELAAHAVHLNRPRASKAFVAVNSAALPEALFESEFFGHEKGAFSGAIAQKQGLLEMAHGGTIFLDEVGELPLAIQAKLLRVLESNEVRRVGGTKTLKVDARIVAATNKDLECGVEQKTFRSDLYHRLNVLSFDMPPLREREEDIVALAHHFILYFNKVHQRRVVGVSPEARERLVKYDWPGNVRELKNVMERGVIMSRTDFLTEEHFPTPTRVVGQNNRAADMSIRDSTKAAQKIAIITAYREAGGNYTRAAEILNIHPNHLHRLIRTLNLKPALLRERL
jgi:transcriptional regulator with GAF, ATPase, and Fis domain